MKKLLAGLLALVFVLRLCGCATMGDPERIRLEEVNRLMMNELVPETEDIPVYSWYDMVYIDGHVVTIADAIEDYKDSGYDFKEVLVVYQDRIYFVLTEKAERGSVWYLMSVNDTGGDLKLHFSDVFCSSEKADTSYYGNDRQVLNFTGNSIEERNGFYAENKIVLTDHRKVVVFDLATEQVNRFAYDEYTYPYSLPIKADIEECQKIIFEVNGKRTVLTVQDAAESSEAFREIMSLEDAKVIDDAYPATLYLFDRVLYSGEELYVFCRILNFWGESYAVAFKYDPESNMLAYAFNIFTNDFPSDISIIPTVCLEADKD